MKNLTKIIVAFVFTVAFTSNSKAQFKANIGVDLGLALENGMGLIYGPAAGIEYGIEDNMGITFQTGYDIISVDAKGASASIIPLQPGFKYYFTDNESGLYAHAQLGFTVYRTKVEFFGISSSASKTYLSYSAGGGYLVNENIDIGARFNIVSSNGGSLEYIAVRAAYNF